ncbi:MAG: hypothetical protein DI555_07610 [Novosphingobium pentaromativorans]|uniref:Uncharacterized protein n=1 Tax=Novosphingobium pentaromativorans TaxID=205844 RepID=A0A2W5NQS2_9SPHN|nr:hypothetical protein [Novosphingobium panipatense]PZQ55871.1 MAG: hypothetical protein DI555_07610 [Novosphingobium pentaromativorans]
MIGKWFKRGTPNSLSQPHISWPNLPKHGFITGRSADVSDLDQGHAVFVQQTDAVSAEPYPIAIPQYAFWKDETGSTVPVIVVQAEHHIVAPEGEPILGLRTLDGENIVASGVEVELLGPDRPI